MNSKGPRKRAFFVVLAEQAVRPGIGSTLT
jgi:hypothetical protein